MKKRKYKTAREKTILLLEKVKKAQKKIGKKIVYLKPGVSGEDLEKGGVFYRNKYKKPKWGK